MYGEIYVSECKLSAPRAAGLRDISKGLNMSIVDTAYLREMHPAFAGDRPTGPFLEICIESAEEEIREWVGDTAYDDAASATPTDEKRKKKLKKAEGELVMYFALPKLNLHIATQGVILSSIEKSQFGTGTIATASPAQLKAIRQPYYDLARHKAADYIIGTPNPKPVKVTT